jgi:hypothetical protein
LVKLTLKGEHPPALSAVKPACNCPHAGCTARKRRRTGNDQDRYLLT